MSSRQEERRVDSPALGGEAWREKGVQGRVGGRGGGRQNEEEEKERAE